MKKVLKIGLLCVFVPISFGFLQAQQSEEELAQAAANPIANMMSFPFQNNTDMGLGEYNRTRNILNIQPVIPLAGGRIITRAIIPIAWLPDTTAETGIYSTGLADTQFTAFYVPPAKGKLMWGPGLVVEIPTGGEMRGSQKWSIGPSIVVLSVSGPWTLGILANNVWSMAGESGRADVNKGLLQYFIVRQLGNGLYINSAPIITVNWEAPSGQQWTVPFGLGIGKVFRLGKLPVNAQIGAYYNVVKPDNGADWQARVQVQFMLPAGGKK